MTIKPITDQDNKTYNLIVSHPLQSWEWGEFREKTGTKVIRRGIYTDNELVDGFQLTIHPIPHTPWTIGYLPKGRTPTNEVLEELVSIGKENKCVFIQLEPNVEKISNYPASPAGKQFQISNFKIKKSAHPLFTRYTFQLDLSKTEEDLLKNMHPKTRYNIKLAKRHGVKIKEENSDETFAKYWQLTEETTKRQGFYAHTKKYHDLQWKTFPHVLTKDKLSSHLFIAKYQEKILTTMLFFVFHDTLYYPYGASSNEHRNVMHSTLTMWEAILWGKKHGLKKFDMWGALGENPNPKDSWIGFHTFKERFGPKHIAYIGSFDLIINPLLYRLYVYTDKLRWSFLHFKNNLKR